MRVTTKRAIPFIFVVISILYIVLGFSLEHQRMIGDERGWDPGSRAMPLGIGFLMFVISVYLMLKETTPGEDPNRQSQADQKDRVDPGSLKLISLTISMSVLYILFFRHLGFILATTLLLFTLIYFNDRQDVTWDGISHFLPGMITSIGVILLLYSIGRFITRLLFLTGKQSGIGILTNRLAITGITLIVLIGIFLIMLLLAKKFLKSQQTRCVLNAVFIATGSTEFLYLIFKQIFWVSLAQGIIFW